MVFQVLVGLFILLGRCPFYISSGCLVAVNLSNADTFDHDQLLYNVGSDHVHAKDFVWVLLVSPFTSGEVGLLLLSISLGLEESLLFH